MDAEQRRLGSTGTRVHEQCPELLQDAINIAGLGVSLDQDSDKLLTCFPDYTSETLSTLIETHLAEGFPSGADNAVDLPYTNIQGDGADGCLHDPRNVE